MGMLIPVDCTTLDDGTLLYRYGDKVCIAISPAQDSRKKPLVTVEYGEQPLMTLRANLLLASDIEQLTRHCGTRVEGVDWHSIFTHISTLVPQSCADTWDLDVCDLSDFRPERKEYLWYPLIPKGEPTSLDGDPGAGKSGLTMKIICHLTSGNAFPSLFNDRPELNFAPQAVVLLTHEDDPGSTILPRVVINGGNPRLVKFLPGKRNAKGERLPITMQDIDILTMALARFKPAMMIFDPIQSFFGNGVDMNKASDTRPVLDAVRNLCKAYGCTPFYVRHNGKSQHAKAMHSGLGSIDIAANMRSVLALYEDAEAKHRRYLAQTKTNGCKAPTMQLALTSATYDFALDDGEVITVEEVKVDWDGLSALSAADLNARQWVQQSADDEEKSALDEAREFLRAILADGPLLTTEALKAAKEAGISEKTIKRAKAMEGIKAQRRPIDGAPLREWPWEWPLTPREPGEDDASF